MAKKNKFHKKKSMTIPLAVVAGFTPLAVGIWNRRTSFGQISQFTTASLTGYEPNVGWNGKYLSQGAIPILAGFAAHFLASRIGINRTLARVGIPFLRI